MLKLFKEIEGILGVRASFAYIQGLGLLYADLPDEYSPILLGQLQTFIDKQHQTAESSETAVNSIEIRFEEATIITREIGSHATLVVIADPQINLGLLDVTFDLLADELQQAAEDIRKDPGRALTSTRKETTATDTYKAWTPAALPPALQPVMQEIHLVLSQTIGPLSSIIMNDSIKSWSQVGPSEADRLNELIDILGMEIGDSAMEAQFRKAIQPVLLHLFTNAKRSSTKEKQSSSPHKIMVSAALAKKLSRLMEVFTEIIGPMGTVIMKSKLRQWAETAPPTEQGIPALLSLLITELKDPAQAEELKRKAALFIN